MTSSTVDLVLKNAKIFTFQGIVTGGLAVEKQKIVKLSKEPELPRADEVVDAKGFLLLPGLIDSHVHLRDMELSYKEDFYTGTCAAAAGGITTVIDMPNTVPRTSSLKALVEKKEEARKKIVVNLAFHAGFPSRLNEVEKMAKEGIVGFKIYPHDPSEEIDWKNEEETLSYLKAAANNNLPVSIHPDDLETINKLQSELRQQKLTDIEVFLGSHPAITEKKAIIKFAKWGIKTGCHIHICHVSSGESLATIKEEQIKGAKLTCETTPHHLFLTKDEIKKQGAFAKVLPPLRTQNDNSALWAALLGGLINTLASDHAPHSLAEKEKPFQDAPSGFPGLETMLPLMLTKVARGDLRLEKLIELTSRSPAQIFKLENKGMLLEGYEADMVLVDFKEKWKINPEKFYSKSKFSPFDGWKVTGKAKMVFIKGLCVMSDEQIIAPQGTGSIINIKR
ncbi:MAG: dihydroorotase family protein [Candidatus Freyarchaeum deiterrae]